VGREYPLEGARFQLDPSLTDKDLDTWGLRPAAKVVARTLQRYGMFLDDNAGAFTIHAQVLDPNARTSREMWEKRCPGLYEDIKKIPADKFRVLDYGTVFDQGRSP
jgi:hypothetical protein